MVKSMTGYGKAEVLLSQGKATVEIRSLNGKNCDISVKSQLIPRDKEIEVRQYIAGKLYRGSIELFVTFEQNSSNSAKSINAELYNNYFDQLRALASGTMERSGTANPNLGALENLLAASIIMRLPDVMETKRQELSAEDWELLYGAIREAVDALDNYRTREGEALLKDVSLRVSNILSFMENVEKHEQERLDSVKERILARIGELSITPDQNRLEQEIVFYVEKLDINEEKVRLRQHCRYFMEMLETDEYPGKKLGFIAQEMGREINTTGSKANHAEIQRWVVRMKDELEKIKEQSLNIL